MWSKKPTSIPSRNDALPGRAEAMAVADAHFVNHHRLLPPFPDEFERAMFAMGCFWGAERKFWELDGVYTTAVGYAGGDTQKPPHREGCSRGTGPPEGVLLGDDPKRGG